MADNSVCTIENCGKKRVARGWCAAHYKRWKLHGDPLRGGPTPRVNTGKCAVKGCDNPDMARGLCRAHYLRWHKHGDPLAGRATMDGEPLRFLEDVALNYASDECLVWPYSRDTNGYAKVAIDGNMRPVSRVLCERVHGNAPSPEYETAHSCGRGNDGCINPRHLRWATHTENIADKLIHGTWLRGEKIAQSKLTEHDVLEIRSLLARVSQREIAERYGVTQSTVARIQSGEIWGWLNERGKHKTPGLA